MAQISTEKIRRLKQTDEVWEGTTRLARFWVTPKNERPYRPHLMTFVSDRGKVIRTDVLEIHPTVGQTWEGLLKAMRRPVFGGGRNRRPQMMVLDDEELVQALTPRLVELDIQCQYRRRLPHLETYLKKLEHRMNRGFPETPNLLSIPDVTVPLLERIFIAAAEFYRTKPWEMLPYEMPIEIRYPLEAEARYAVVIGAAGESFGLSVNDDREGLQLMFAGLSPEELVEKTSWLALTYELPLALAFDDLDAIARFDWPIPNGQAYPSITRVGSEQELLPPTLQDLIWLEAVLPVLSLFFQEYFELDESGQVRPCEYVISTKTINGPAEISLRLPVEVV